jgi:uncharacterized protein involved in exopolysaccharide biosynthesis
MSTGNQFAREGGIHSSMPPDSLERSPSQTGPWVPTAERAREEGIARAMRVASEQPRLIGAIALITALVATPILMLQPRQYASVGSFIIQGSRAGPSMSSLASQFGISVPNADARQSPAFFGDLLRSRKILETAADARYCAPCNVANQPQPLPDLLEIKGGSAMERREKAIELLAKRVAAAVSPRTGLVTFEVTLPSPLLAKQVADRLLDEVARFNLGMRQSDMLAERRFSERRLEEVATDLRRAEQALSNFRSANRNYQGSAGLSMREEELRREVGIRQQLYLALAQSVAQARMEEGRDTPVLSVVDPPLAPFRPKPRGIAVKAAFALLFGALIGLAFAVIRDRRRERRTRR